MKNTSVRKSASAVIIFLLIFPVSLFAQDTISLADQIEGTWTGTIELGEQKLPLVININESDGAYFGTFDSPEQGVFGISIEDIIFDEDSIYLEIKRKVAHYKGAFNASYTSIEGIWSQSGIQLPLSLVKTEEEFRQTRPQDPTKPFPYAVQDVLFRNSFDEITLAGTITMPSGEGPWPGVVLISGSGPQNRDEEIYGHRPFLVLADYLTRNGYAVLRYDDRGTGQSEGTFNKASLTDLKNDAHAALTFLKSYKNVVPGKVGSLGHSEGGLLAAKISQQEEMAFMVLLSSPAQQGIDILIAQNRLILNKSGFSERAIETQLKFLEKIYSVIQQQPDKHDAQTMIDTYIHDSVPEGILSKQNLGVAANQLLSPWAQEFLTYNPVDDLKNADEPVLAIFGGKDVQVPKENAAYMDAILEDNPESEVVLFNDLNHLLQNADTGLPNEYGRIQETIDPTVLKTISNWLDEVVN